jgi:hypothetical protein
MWLWAPLQAEDCEILFYVMEWPTGEAMVQGAQIAPLGGEPEHMADTYADLEFRPGTREISRATLHFIRKRGRGEVKVVLTPSRHRMFLNGLGYGHPEWGLGMDKGEFAVAYDRFEPGAVTVHAEPHMHHMWAQYQARTEGEAVFPDGRRIKALGCLEQIVLGSYAPLGLKGLTDPLKS